MDAISVNIEFPSTPPGDIERHVPIRLNRNLYCTDGENRSSENIQEDIRVKEESIVHNIRRGLLISPISNEELQKLMDVIIREESAFRLNIDMMKQKP
ncbi:hypothetical protein WA026_005596 [Henosepilachna vigintioctopunctata]|uniref:Uncharacterized protein n=1 Tax=Henosepilachna vigintioctopunctata TaxID=420089 RepID=A0AAW1U3Q4_9CUCU